MYIVAIAWMYVTILMAATQDTVLAGLSTLVFYGLVPCAVVMYVLMAPTRARRKKAQAQRATEPSAGTINSSAPPLQTDPSLIADGKTPAADR
jgi:TRAP-type C4-dicarboxylate transport system permease small subunit